MMNKQTDDIHEFPNIWSRLRFLLMVLLILFAAAFAWYGVEQFVKNEVIYRLRAYDTPGVYYLWDNPPRSFIL